MSLAIFPSIVTAITVLLTVISYVIGTIFAEQFLRYTATQKVVIKSFSLILPILCIEYFIFGSNSFIFWTSEGEYVAAILNYLSNFHDGGMFSHSVQGGSDIATAVVSGFEIFSVERVLFAFFPTWIAILIHKAIVFSVGFWGAYLLARETGKCEYGLAIAIAIIYLFSFWQLVDQTLMSGLGKVINPLAIFVMVCQLERPKYAQKVGLFSILAMTVEPTHSLLSMLFAIAMGWVVLSRKHILRLFIATAFLGIPYLINWHEVLYGYIEIIEHTMRVTNVSDGPTFIDLTGHRFEQSQTSLSGAFYMLFGAYVPNYVFWLYLGSLIILSFRSPISALNSVLGFCCFAFLMIFLHAFNWNFIGLGIINGLSTNYSLDAFFAFALIPMAQAVNHFTSFNQPGLRYSWKSWWFISPRAILPATALAALVYTKTFHAYYFIQYGGQSVYHSISNLSEPKWAPNEPFKTVTLWNGKFTPTLVPGFYGIAALDTQFSNYLLNFSRYWWFGLQSEKMESLQVLLPRNFAYWSKSEKKYDIKAHGVSFPLLGAANVRYILSPLPLKGTGLKKVSGPGDGTPVHVKPQSTDEIVPYILDRLDKNFGYGKIYVYELPNFLPRVYAAKETLFVSNDLTDTEYFNELEKVALERNVVIKEKNSRVLPRASNTLKVTDFSLVKNGFNISVNAPEGGVVIVNTPWIIFWKAWADKTLVRTAEINGIQTGIEVPPKTHKIKMRYCRPTVRDKIKKFLNRPALCSSPPKE